MSVTVQTGPLSEGPTGAPWSRLDPIGTAASPPD